MPLEIQIYQEHFKISLSKRIDERNEITRTVVSAKEPSRKARNCYRKTWKSFKGTRKSFWTEQRNDPDRRNEDEKVEEEIIESILYRIGK